ncbi:MAG: S-methyl-5-thioribose-1-phosphate isomerase [Halanaerobium sp.]|nr:S-methyl-5-thioribose-1-phosphate isomerase [Halanaerobium sp.]
MDFPTIEFTDNKLRLIDQRKLPTDKSFYEASNYQEVVYAIREMVVRGAPAIGATGAYGVVLAAMEYQNLERDQFLAKVKEANREMVSARPTAVNLPWAIERMEKILLTVAHRENEEIITVLLDEADKIAAEDVETNKMISKHGNEIVPHNATILTHCNTGALATVDYGTALGIIREAHSSGKNIHVYADETRPRLQGARLTAYELVEEGIPATLIADSVAATLIRDGKIDLILLGADRIAINGDVANKIGTYMLSELAKKFEVPFYSVAPISTIDFKIASGAEIEIEERDPDEVRQIRGVQVAPAGVGVYNPAFDVTPASNITGIITEKGIIKPCKEEISKLKD